MANSKMKTLINDLKSGLEAAITAGSINTKKIYKGLHEDPSQLPLTKFPYVALDEDGERVEDTDSNMAQIRVYRVIFDMATYRISRTLAVDSILDLTQEVKDWLELDSTKLLLRTNNSDLDGHRFAIDVFPYEWNQDEKYFFRGRTVIVEFFELEDRIFEW